MFLRLGGLPLKIMPRHREGPPRCKGPPRHVQLCLGEPGNMECELFGPPRLTYNCLRPVFMACFMSIS